MDRRQSPRRAGFTLIEVLIAVTIIALLVALLLPAVKGAVRTAYQAQVTAELNNMATGLASFKNTYNDYPPSRIILPEQGFTAYINSLSAGQLAGPAGPFPPGDTNDTDISLNQLIQRSRLYLRKFWTRVDFDGGSNGTGSIGFDFNNNGTTADVLHLSGSECLTFFLGGQPNISNNGGNFTYGLSGFSKLPTNPFLGLLTNPTATNRTVPNYEFNNARLVDLDGDGIPSYLDPLDTTPGNQRAYAYFCSYGTNSYDPNDVNGYGKNYDQSGVTADLGDFELEDDGATPVERGFTTGLTMSSGTSNSAVSPAPNPYCSGNPVTTGGMSWINPNSFQLFSAGLDRNWGLGGQYAQNSLAVSGKLPIAPADAGILNAVDFANGIRGFRESDNLTNFSGGRLD